MVLPAPVSPVITLRPGPSSSTDSSMTPSERIRSSSITRSAAVVACGGAARRPRQPSTGRPNLATSRSVNGAECSRASRTGVAPRRTSIRAPGGSSTVRRPSHHSTPALAVLASTSTASTLVGRHHEGPGEQRVRADRHHQQRLHARPHDRAPGGEVVGGEPVGVAHTTPSQPHRDSGRPSTSTTTSSIRSRAAFSTLASLRAQVLATAPCRPGRRRRRWSAGPRRCSGGSTIASIVTSRSSDSGLREEPDVARG